MYNTYKPFRYFFRALNLVVYAGAASVLFITVLNEIYISDIMNSIFQDYLMSTGHALIFEPAKVITPRNASYNVKKYF